MLTSNYIHSLHKIANERNLPLKIHSYSSRAQGNGDNFSLEGQTIFLYTCAIFILSFPLFLPDDKASD